MAGADRVTDQVALSGFIERLALKVLSRFTFAQSTAGSALNVNVNAGTVTTVSTVTTVTTSNSTLGSAGLYPTSQEVTMLQYQQSFRRNLVVA